MIDITVENIEKTLREITRYNTAKEKEVDKIVRKYAKEIVKRAKANAPVGKTGNLKKSIRAKYFVKNHGPSATVFPRGRKGAHRHLVEYGTNPRTVKNYFGQKGVSRSVGRMPAKPFMRPAHESVVGRYLADMKKVVDKVDTV